jgi:hypothetical protein
LSGKAHRADDIISLNCDEVINVAKKRHFVTMATQSDDTLKHALGSAF